MERLEVSGAERPIYGSLGVKRLKNIRKICIEPVLVCDGTLQLLSGLNTH